MPNTRLKTLRPLESNQRTAICAVRNYCGRYFFYVGHRSCVGVGYAIFAPERNSYLQALPIQADFPVVAGDAVLAARIWYS